MVLLAGQGRIQWAGIRKETVQLFFRVFSFPFAWNPLVWTKFLDLLRSDVTLITGTRSVTSLLNSSTGPDGDQLARNSSP